MAIPHWVCRAGLICALAGATGWLAAACPAQSANPAGAHQTSGPVSSARIASAGVLESSHDGALAPDDSASPETSAAAAGTHGPSVRSLVSFLRAGGPMLIPLGVCSFLVCVFTFERAISLRRGRVIPKPFVVRFLHQLEEEQLDCPDALALCRENGSPIAEVFAAAVIKWGRPAVEVEQAIIDSGERIANQLRRYLRLFNGISTISPLFGLLGTVMGMIESFNVIATTNAMGRPDLLASGISEALITTAAGLTVAIPALVAYLVFSSRVDRLVIEIDRLGQRVVNVIASDGYRERKTSAKRKTKEAA